MASKTTTVRIPDDLVNAIEDERARLRARVPSLLRVTFADALREVVVRGLAVGAKANAK